MAQHAIGFRPPVWNPQEVRAHRLVLRSLTTNSFGPLQVTSILPWWLSDLGRLPLIYFVVHWSISLNILTLATFPFYDPWAYVLAFSLLAVAARDPGSVTGAHQPLRVPLRLLRLEWFASRSWHTSIASLRVSLLAGAVVGAFNLGNVFGDELGFDFAPDGTLVTPSFWSKAAGTVGALLWGIVTALVVEVLLRIVRKYKSAWVFSNSRFAHPPKFATLSPITPRWRLSKVQLIAFYAYFGFFFVTGGGSRWLTLLLAALLTPALCFGIPSRDVPDRSRRLAGMTTLWALGRAALLIIGLVAALLNPGWSIRQGLLRELGHATAGAEWKDIGVVVLLALLSVLSLALTITSVSWVGDRAVLAVYLASQGVHPAVWRSVTALQRRGAFVEFAGHYRGVPPPRLPYQTP